MYGSSQPMNLPTQIAADDADDAPVSAGTDNHHHHHHHHEMTYDPHSLEDGVAVEDVAADPLYASAAAGSDIAVARVDDSSQLTLSFRGQCYVFDAITPDKFQAVLLLLGACEMPSASMGMEMMPQNQRGVLDFPTRCSQPQRVASLNRFRQKRKERCFDKKVRYSVRQEVALRMQRNKGQFTSSKKSEGTYGWGSGQESGQEDTVPETSCTHCSISSKATPMMRRGPAGPRSLCNACGLFWANKGALRDLSKKTQEHSLTPTEQGESEANDSDPGIAIDTHNNLVSFSNPDNSAVITEQ